MRIRYFIRTYSHAANIHPSIYSSSIIYYPTMDSSYPHHIMFNRLCSYFSPHLLSSPRFLFNFITLAFYPDDVFVD